MPVVVRALTVAFAAILLIGGCSNVNPTNPDHVDNPLSDSETRAQVVDPLKTLVKSMGLDVILASFAFESCNDQNEIPFRGRSSASFSLPGGTTAEVFRQRIHDELIESLGWKDGPPPGKTLYGLSAHRGEMMAIMTINNDQTTIPGTIQVDIVGECRDTTDHAGAALEKVTNELARWR